MDPKAKIFIVEGKGTISLPCDEENHTSKQLHLKKDWDWTGEKNIMYHISFEGHLFGASKPILAIAVGYLNGKQGHCYDDISHMTDAIRITIYKSSDGKLTFKLTPATDWHATDLSVTLFRGKNCYHRAAWKTFRILSVWHE